MIDKKLKILELMKELPQDMIDDYKECVILPLQSITVDILCRIFKCNCDSVGYTKNVILKIDNFYNELFLNNLYE